MFTVIDTGGFVSNSDNLIEREIVKQLVSALGEASVILFMVDTREGVHPFDSDLSTLLRHLKKPIFLVANKAETNRHVHDAQEFHALGIGDHFHVISAADGSGTGDLLDKVVEYFDPPREPKPGGMPRIAVVGRPNVGKSSFVNALLGQDRCIVTDMPGTTRDAVETVYNRFGKEFKLVDTSGIRKKSKIAEPVEFYSIMRAIHAIQNCDVCILLVDISEGLLMQDLQLIRLCESYRRGILLMANKWDLIEKDHHSMGDFRKMLQEKLGPFAYIPLIFTSVTQKKRIFQTVTKALEVYANMGKKIPTSKLNRVLLPIISEKPAPRVRDREVRIKYITQLPSKNVNFAFFCNYPKSIKDVYRRFLINQIRKHFNFEGVKIQVVFRQK